LRAVRAELREAPTLAAWLGELILHFELRKDTSLPQLVMLLESWLAEKKPRRTRWCREGVNEQWRALVRSVHHQHGAPLTNFNAGRYAQQVWHTGQLAEALEAVPSLCSRVIKPTLILGERPAQVVLPWNKLVASWNAGRSPQGTAAVGAKRSLTEESLGSGNKGSRGWKYLMARCGRGRPHPLTWYVNLEDRVRVARDFISAGRFGSERLSRLTRRKAHAYVTLFSLLEVQTILPVASGPLA
jgi:hypothetical protein